MPLPMNSSVMVFRSLNREWKSSTNRAGLTVFATLLPHEDRQHLVDNGILVFNADVTSGKQTEGLLHVVEELTGGRLDALVNNAYVCFLAFWHLE